MISSFKERLYAILVLAGSICGLFFINQTNTISIFLLIISIMASIVFGREKRFRSFRFITAVIHVGLDLIWIISGNYFFYCATMIIGLLMSVYMLIAQIIDYERHSEHRKSLKILTGVVSGVLIFVSAFIGIFLSAVAINPNVLISPMQKKFNAVNSFSPANEITETKWGSNGAYINDICYGNTYPNSYLDIYISSVGGENKPTYFFIHGGGYVWGDKIGGDPNTRDSGLEWYINTFLENGINVVSPNYCFAPEYSYPTQVVQLNECLDFLVQHGVEYGISMDRVIIGGGSAGGNLAGMLGLVCTNQDIAAELGTKLFEGYFT